MESCWRLLSRSKSFVKWIYSGVSHGGRLDKNANRIACDFRVMQIGKSCGMEADAVCFCLYKLACWFRVHGDYGVMNVSQDLIDYFLKADGFADAMERVGFLKTSDDCVMLKAFCDVSSIRKSIGKRLRADVLAIGKCVVCDDSERLVVDHIKPVFLGGATERENLQCLCFRCNLAKGKRTMEEFLNDRRS
jgi:hypothetical protein